MAVSVCILYIVALAFLPISPSPVEVRVLWMEQDIQLTFWTVRWLGGDIVRILAPRARGLWFDPRCNQPEYFFFRKDTVPIIFFRLYGFIFSKFKDYCSFSSIFKIYFQVSSSHLYWHFCKCILNSVKICFSLTVCISVIIEIYY